MKGTADQSTGVFSGTWDLSPDKQKGTFKLTSSSKRTIQAKITNEKGEENEVEMETRFSHLTAHQSNQTKNSTAVLISTISDRYLMLTTIDDQVYITPRAVRISGEIFKRSLYLMSKITDQNGKSSQCKEKIEIKCGLDYTSEPFPLIITSDGFVAGAIPYSGTLSFWFAHLSQ